MAIAKSIKEAIMRTYTRLVSKLSMKQGSVTVFYDSQSVIY